MWNRKRTPAACVALGGVLAAASVVMMGLGGLIPIATYVCPVAAMMILQLVLKLCGRRMAWAWYGAVAILSLVMSPDKEAGAVFLFLGFYPIVKPRLDAMKLPWLAKTLFFNLDILLLYWILMHIMGMSALQQEFREMGIFLVVSLLVLGNVTFFMLDFVLGRKFRGKKPNG